MILLPPVLGYFIAKKFKLTFKDFRKLFIAGELTFTASKVLHIPLVYGITPMFKNGALSFRLNHVHWSSRKKRDSYRTYVLYESRRVFPSLYKNIPQIFCGMFNFIPNQKVKRPQTHPHLHAQLRPPQRGTQLHNSFARP